MYTAIHIQIQEDTEIKTGYLDGHGLIMLDLGSHPGTTILLSADDAKRVIAVLQTAIYDAERRNPHS